jgi:hypothetical protein
MHGGQQFPLAEMAIPMPTKRVSFCIDAEGAQRELFFVLESDKTGDLKLIFRRTLYHNPDNKGDPLAGKLIDEQRYSIHTSPESIHEINTIHHTYRVGEEILNGYSFTRVIKARSGFVPLFSRRYPNLAMPHYVPSFKRSTIVAHLGEYDPTVFMLLCTVFLGPPGRAFSLYGDNDARAVQYQFAKFSIVVIWNFLSLPSIGKGWNMHVEIPHPEAIAKIDPELSRIDRPLQEFDCLSFHFRRCAYLRHQFLCSISDDTNRNLSAIVGQFFKYASSASSEYIEYGRRVNVALLFPIPTYVVEEGSYTLEDGRHPVFE